MYDTDYNKTRKNKAIGILRSVTVAFSIYSRIPMPVFEWTDDDRNYSMCAFPLVGLVISFIQYGAFCLLGYVGATGLLSASLLTLIPLLLTGCIHMDGYMDTHDAMGSCADRERKLEILKDPHTGAFAVIYGVGYIMLTIALWNELISRGNTGQSFLFCLLPVYILSRLLSAMCVMTLKKARKEGMLSDVCSMQDRRCIIILAFMLVLFIVVMSFLFGIRCILILLPAPLLLPYYRYMSYKYFGGITGDLAGWFLQVYELAALAFVTAGAFFL
jgi:adenosylcobinamide-GDP ribazoletransferase